MKFEVDFSRLHIKKLTPYLDKIETPKKNKKSKNKSYIKLRQRAFCWYYVHNGRIKSDAYRRAFHSKYSKKYDVLVLDDLTDTKFKPTRIAVEARRLYRKAYIQKCIELIWAEIEKEIRTDIPTLLDQLKIQATYDPSMFINERGGAQFKYWDDIPVEYRCCIEGIETKYHGKNAEVRTVHIKLVDRAKARDKLLKLAPGLLEPEKIDILHKTIDTDGNEIGIDFSKMSDSDLKQKILEIDEE